MVSGRISQDIVIVKPGVVLHSAEHTARRALLPQTFVGKFKGAFAILSMTLLAKIERR
jgi:hypothetical protein